MRSYNLMQFNSTRRQVKSSRFLANLTALEDKLNQAVFCSLRKTRAFFFQALNRRKKSI